MLAVFRVTDLSLTFYIIFCLNSYKSFYFNIYYKNSNATDFVSLLFLESGCVYKTVFPRSRKKEYKQGEVKNLR